MAPVKLGYWKIRGVSFSFTFVHYYRFILHQQNIFSNSSQILIMRHSNLYQSEIRNK